MHDRRGIPAAGSVDGRSRGQVARRNVRSNDPSADDDGIVGCSAFLPSETALHLRISKLNVVAIEKKD